MRGVAGGADEDVVLGRILSAVLSVAIEHVAAGAGDDRLLHDLHSARRDNLDLYELAIGRAVVAEPLKQVVVTDLETELDALDRENAERVERRLLVLAVARVFDRRVRTVF